MSTVLTVLKMLGILLSCSLGAVGTVKQYRLPDGRTTLWGRIALVGVFVGGALAFGVQTLEVVIGRQSAESQIALSNQLLDGIKTQVQHASFVQTQILQQTELTRKSIHEINRIQTKIECINIVAGIELPLDDPEVKRYIMALDPHIEHEKSSKGLNLGYCPLNVSAQSPLFPTLSEYPKLYWMCTHPRLRLELYKNVDRPADMIGASRLLECTSNLLLCGENGDSSLTYFRSESGPVRLELSLNMLHVETQRPSEKQQPIRSLTDLRDITVLFLLGPFSLFDKYEGDRELWTHARLQNVFVDFGDCSKAFGIEDHFENRLQFLGEYDRSVVQDVASFSPPIPLYVSGFTVQAQP